MSSKEASDALHILIVGAGAVGAFYGSRLHQPDHLQRPVQVSLVCRSNYEHVLTHGLELQTRSFGSYHFHPHQVFSSVSDAASSSHPWHFIILCTKVLLDRTDDAALLAPLIETQARRGQLTPTIVLIQNGLGFESVHRARFPQVPIISAVTVVNAQQISPGLVRQNQWTRISLGPFVEFDYGPKQKDIGGTNVLAQITAQQVKLLADLLVQGGIKDAKVHGETELQLVRWHKLAINAAMNPSSVLSGGLTNAQMVKDPIMRAHIAETMTEVISGACKILSIDRFPTEQGFASVERVIESTERGGDDVRSSMSVDWKAGRPLELEAILGVPCRIARQRGVVLSRLETMYAFLKSLERIRSVPKL